MNRCWLFKDTLLISLVSLSHCALENNVCFAKVICVTLPHNTVNYVIQTFPIPGHSSPCGLPVSLRGLLKPPFLIIG